MNFQYYKTDDYHAFNYVDSNFCYCEWLYKGMLRSCGFVKNAPYWKHDAYFPKFPDSNRNEVANSHPLKNAFFVNEASASHSASANFSTASFCSLLRVAFAFSCSSAAIFVSPRSSSVSIAAHSEDRYSFHSFSSVVFIFNYLSR